MADVAIKFPAASDATIPLNVTGTLVLTLPPEIVKVAIATDPFGMTFVVRSNITHNTEDADTLEHDGVFGTPIQLALGATATARPVTSAG